MLMLMLMLVTVLMKIQCSRPCHDNSPALNAVPPCGPSLVGQDALERHGWHIVRARRCQRQRLACDDVGALLVIKQHVTTSDFKAHRRRVPTHT